MGGLSEEAPLLARMTSHQRAATPLERWILVGPGTIGQAHLSPERSGTVAPTWPASALIAAALRPLSAVHSNTAAFPDKRFASIEVSEQASRRNGPAWRSWLREARQVLATVAPHTFPRGPRRSW